MRWTASDQDGDSLQYAVQYSADGGASWTAVGVGQALSQYTIDATTLPGGNQGLIRVIASDGFHTASDTGDAVFTVSTKPPQPLILSPSDGATLPAGEAGAFVGSAYDPEDGPLQGASLSWHSDRDGMLGQGRQVLANALSAGRHVVTLTARDSDGQEASTSIDIYVGRRTYMPVLLR